MEELMVMLKFSCLRWYAMIFQGGFGKRNIALSQTHNTCAVYKACTLATAIATFATIFTCRLYKKEKANVMTNIRIVQEESKATYHKSKWYDVQKNIQ
jgi:hypothetical protein